MDQLLKVRKLVDQLSKVIEINGSIFEGQRVVVDHLFKARKFGDQLLLKVRELVDKYFKVREFTKFVDKLSKVSENQ